MAQKMSELRRATIMQSGIPPMAFFELAQIFARWSELQHDHSARTLEAGDLGNLSRGVTETAGQWAERIALGVYTLSREV